MKGDNLIRNEGGGGTTRGWMQKRGESLMGL
jgi:hypothetical protein